jgi:hypothetical protein
MFTNWKTTSAGILAIVTAITGLAFAIINKAVTAEVIITCASGILLGLGLMFAKDQNVTGGNVSNGLKLPNAGKVLILAVMLSGIGLAAQAQNPVSIWKPVPKNLLQLEKVTINTPQALTTPGIWIWRFQAAIVATELTYDKTSKQWQSNALSAVGPGVGYKYYTTNADGTLINTFGFNFLLLLGTDLENVSIASVKPALTVSAFNFLNIGADYNLGNNKIGLLLGATVTF